MIDVQEGPEPNGLGIVEASGAGRQHHDQPPGTAYVIHGTLAPWRDADGDGALDPDVDTYVVQVGRPMLLEVTADGLGGVLAGFVAVAAAARQSARQLAALRRPRHRRYSRRQLFLPKPGAYRIAIGDTRTLAEYEATGASATSSGDYYVSVNDLGTTVATPLTAVGGVATITPTVAADTLAFDTLPKWREAAQHRRGQRRCRRSSPAALRLSPTTTRLAVSLMSRGA